MTQQPMTTFFPRFSLTRREMMCFMAAAAIHSLLFLWKGGVLSFPETPGSGLGEVLTGVDFMAEIPNFDAGGGGGARQQKPQGILARMKSMIQPKSDLAMGGKTQKAQIPSSQADEVQPLQSKQFADKTGFEGLINKKTDMNIARGTSKEVAAQPSIGNFEQAQPNLKQSSFKVAKKDMPFPVLQSSQQNALVNVNAVPVAVGRTTTPNVKSLDGGPSVGAALQSKEFAGSGARTSSGFGSAPSAGSGGSGGGLATGSSRSGSIVTGSGSGLAGSGTGSGTGSGSGSGAGAGTGNGFGNGSGSGRAWGSGSGTGFGVGSGSQMAALPRNTVNEPAGMKGSSKDSGFSITGALARRPVLSKQLPPYSQDARVALRFRVDWSGKVLDGILVEISSGNPSFDRQVMAALKNWLFSKLPADRSNEIQEGVITFVFKGV